MRRLSAPVLTFAAVAWLVAFITIHEPECRDGAGGKDR
jgi:hypothetical protein